MSDTLTLTYNQKTYAIPYTVIKSSRKTYSITVDEDALVIFRVPLRTGDSQIMQLAREKSRWIINHYTKMCEKIDSDKESDLTDNQRLALEARYKEAARSYIPKRTAYYQPMTGGTYTRITIRDQKTRWGSCSSKGTLSFNWRLMLAPPAVLDYVVVHELTHLTYMNHSKEFWLAVEKVCPNYRLLRKWLKDHGHELKL